MRFISSLVTLAAICYGAYWANLRHPDLKHKALEFVNSGEFHTLEARFTAKQIMDLNQANLLKDTRHKFLGTSTKFAPYLLMQVKYTKSDLETNEGLMLWDLLDGEMVVNTNHWEKTHGFGDCIKSNVHKNEFKILNLLSEKGGILDRESLLNILQVENDVLGSWLDSCRKKQLIVQSGNHYRIHLHNPRINVNPETVIDDRLVTKSYKNADRLARRFSRQQIKQLSESAFGRDFAIRHMMYVFLPIYSITVQNPDESQHTSYWNAINGRQIAFTSLIE